MFSLLAVGVSCASGLRASFVATDADACRQQTSYQDSVALIRERLRSSDSVLRRYDLSQVEDPLFRLKHLKDAKTNTDSVHALSTPSIERKVVALRAQGGDASELDMYLGMYEMLDARPAWFTADSANRQVAAIHKLEADSLYMAYVRETNHYSPDNPFAPKRYASDTMRLSRAASEASSRCLHYHFELPFDLAVWLLSLSALFVSWWWWFGGRKT
jgi:hypothetical protein